MKSRLHIKLFCTIKVFNGSGNAIPQLTSLLRPVELSLLRIVVVPGSWSGTRSCLRAEAYGCTVEQSKPTIPSA